MASVRWRSSRVWCPARQQSEQTFTRARCEWPHVWLPTRKGRFDPDCPHQHHLGRVAQLVERQVEALRVGRSNRSVPTCNRADAKLRWMDQERPVHSCRRTARLSGEALPGTLRVRAPSRVVAAHRRASSAWTCHPPRERRQARQSLRELPTQDKLAAFEGPRGTRDSGDVGVRVVWTGV